MSEAKNLIFYLWQENRGKTLGVIIGLILGLLVTILGFLKSLVLLLFALAGFFIGKYFDEEIKVKELKDEDDRSLLDSQ